MKTKSQSKVASARFTILLTTVLATGILVSPARAQSAAAASKTAPTAAHTRYQPTHFPKRARETYGLVLGVDSLAVKSVEAGELIRFSYRVVDPTKAQMLNDKKQEPLLNDERAHVQLVVPKVAFVGPLRQSTTPEMGKVYWIMFSNKGGNVKRGDRVSVLVGKVHLDNLLVE